MFNLINRGELQSITEHEFENLNSRLKNLWLVEHNDDGSHQTELWGFAEEVHVHDTADITTGALEKARQHAQTAYKDEANTWALDQTLTGKLIANGGTIRFPATQVPSAGANDLDDYEEGTWTPSLLFGGAATGMVYATQTGFHTKIGNKVTVEVIITLTAKGSSTGVATITGLPFTAAHLPTAPVDLSVFATGLTGMPFIVTSGVTIFLVQSAATGRAQLDDTNFTNSSVIQFSMTYLV